MTDSFSNFGLPAKLMQAIARLQFTAPTPVQAQAIPLVLAGKDLMATAQTGTGKTAAFGIPLISQMMDAPQATAIILAPTRELASQIVDTLQQLIPLPTIKTALLIGGEAMPKQFRQLQQHPQIIVGTPGRINDHLLRGTLKLNRTRFLVLDETDRMLDMGFGAQIEKIIQHIPAERQTLMFSATLPPNILKLSSKYLHNPARVAIGTANAPALQVKQEMVAIAEGEKYAALLLQLQQRQGSIIVFVKTKHGADRLAGRLNRDRHRADAIHGNLRQRQRDKVIGNFRDEKYRILVATDVAARGLDIPHIEHVINYDLPQAPEDYIHRIGRTGRAGASGQAVSLITAGDKAKWHAIQRLINPGEAPRGRSGEGEKTGRPQGQHRKKHFRHSGRRHNAGGKSARGGHPNARHSAA
ncbi:MAG TPA: DEAD/DEAH box helicase [Alphaproteobacteria bacterium]|nr:DEAD/DEAH box helicase [Alphaproteobacteria bacterium]